MAGKTDDLIGVVVRNTFRIVLVVSIDAYGREVHGNSITYFYKLVSVGTISHNYMEHIDQLARIIWDYHHMNHVLKKSDCIFVLGSNDIRMAEHAADLYLQGYAPFIIFSGGFGRLTGGVFKKPEADLFADVAAKKGVPPEKIFIENKSTNTGENIELTKKLLAEKGLNFDTFIVVQKPYMERRAYATFKKCWPEKECIISSPSISFESYPNQEISKETLINVMVGDLQRIKIYPEKGFQIFQEIPTEVWNAYEELVKLGYTHHLVEE